MKLFRVKDLMINVPPCETCTFPNGEVTCPRATVICVAGLHEYYLQCGLHPPVHALLYTGLHLCLYPRLHSGVHLCLHLPMHGGLHVCLYRDARLSALPRARISAPMPARGPALDIALRRRTRHNEA